MHADNEEVKAAEALEYLDSRRAFDTLKRKGIHRHNLEKLKEDNVDPSSILVERKARKEREKREQRVSCSTCQGFFIEEHLAKHKRRCSEAERTTKAPTGIPIELLARDGKYSEEFHTTILRFFHQDRSGNFCRSDEFIKGFGYHHFRRVQSKVDKSQSHRKTIMREMRQTANLFFCFKEVAEQDNKSVTSTLDFFDTNNFQCFMDAINVLTSREEGGQKSGAKKNLGHLINNIIRYYKGKCIWERDEAKLKEADYFERLLKHFAGEIFEGAQYNCVKNRQLELRRPKHLPDEEDCFKLRNYTLDVIRALQDDFIFQDNAQYSTLRDAVVCRLTLFNARRGGEPSRLTLKEWNDAEKGVWIDETRNFKPADELEKALMGKYKLAYQSGKNISHMVPNLIPNDTLKAIRKLADPVVREQSGVNKLNTYLFPSIKNSLFHVSGWKCVNNICKQADLSKHINATQMRHRMSTIYAGLDIPEHQRQAFYRHMGHSEEINKNIYQCPLATQEITIVGKFLDTIDTGE